MRIEYQHDIMILVMCHPKPELTDDQKKWLYRFAPRGRIKIICNPKVDRDTMFNQALKDIMENPNTFSKVMIVHDDVEFIDKESEKIFEAPYDITGCYYADSPYPWNNETEWHSGMVIFKTHVIESFLYDREPFFHTISHKRDGRDVLVYDHCRSIARRAAAKGYTMGNVGECNHLGRQRWMDGM